jgi:fimbrial chaperone protein
MSIKIILATLCVGLVPAFAQAFRLSPMVVYFSPQSNKTTQVLLLENQGTEKVPVQIEAMARSVDKAGEEVRTKTDDFVIYPEQLVLLPGEKRNVRLTFSGQLKGDQEQAYRIIASQLPVKFAEKNAVATNPQNVNLNFLLQYVASAYVAPAGAKSQVKVKEARRVDAKKISLTIANEGTAHRVLNPKSLSIYNGDKLQFQMNNVKELEHINLLPKTEKTVVIVVPKEVSAQNLKAELSLTEIVD